MKCKKCGHTAGFFNLKKGLCKSCREGSSESSNAASDGLFSNGGKPTMSDREIDESINMLTKLLSPYLEVQKYKTGSVPMDVALHPFIIGFYYGFAHTLTTTAAQKIDLTGGVGFEVETLAITRALGHEDSERSKIVDSIQKYKHSEHKDFMEAMSIGGDILIAQTTNNESMYRMNHMIMNGKAYQIWEDAGHSI